MESFDRSLFNLDNLIEFRHWMHENAELSWNEYNTVNKIREFLTQQLQVKESQIQAIAKTGLIVTLQGTGAPHGVPLTIALRSDHDGLPIDELNKELPYVSKTEAAHMCGHDGHTTMMLGGIALIAANLDKIPSDRTVKCFFQPAEEGQRGAKKMIEEGCMDGVDEVYGCHNMPVSGSDKKILINDLEMMAQISIYDIEIKGVSGHGSRPECCNNPIPAAARFYMKVFKFIEHYQIARDAVRFSFTQLAGGSTFNCIPEICRIQGSLRTFDDQDSDKINAQIKKIAKEIEDDAGVKIDVKITLGADGAVVNTPRCAQFVRKIAQKKFGAEAVSDDGTPVYASEDFADFQKLAPGAFFFAVVNNLPSHVGLHHN